MIVVGLGNPGRKYERTRHNVGFMIVDRLVDQLNGTKWKKERGVRWSKVDEHWVIKPQEYMNMSGASLKSFLDYKHLNLTDVTQLLVVHDDLDFPLGEMHEQVNRSAGGHNGVQSIIDALGTQNFGRLRIGIGNNHSANVPAEDYVLQIFTPIESQTIKQAVDQAGATLRQRLGA
ncbi:MAG: aminoacyl-tRNA hydrolase [Patescibacteria group bacterium]